MYQKIVRPILFKYSDPEAIHHWTIHRMSEVSRVKLLNSWIHNYCVSPDPVLQVKIDNMVWPNPVGLAAGFDKYIDAPLAYPMLGFGAAELGSITYAEQAGNAKPRLWRLPADQGLIVYYGLANGGAVKTAAKLEKVLPWPHAIPYGISVAPSNGLALEQMAEDYCKSIGLLHKYADYITLNVSCPNVAAKDIFSQVSFIVELMGTVRRYLNDNNITKPFMVKIGPGHSAEDLQKIMSAAVAQNCAGIIATNLIKNRALAKFNSSPEALNHPGGISGKKLTDLSFSTIKQLYKAGQGKVKVIGVGGVFTAEDAYLRIRAGATALQLITGFIYGGPFSVRNIQRGLADLLKRDGFKSVSEAVGVDANK